MSNKISTYPKAMPLNLQKESGRGISAYRFNFCLWVFVSSMLNTSNKPAVLHSLIWEFRKTRGKRTAEYSERLAPLREQFLTVADGSGVVHTHTYIYIHMCMHKYVDV